MLSMDKMDVDLSIVKKERLELDDYGQNHGNILDNFLSEHDYNDFPQSVPTVPCSDDGDVDVDWLSSFFDEPIHDNMSGLNPPLSDISSTHPTQSIVSINGSGDGLFLDSFSTFTEDYINSTNFDTNSLKKQNLPISPTLGKNNPFLSQTNNKVQSDIEMSSTLKNQPLKIELNNSNSHATSNTTNKISSAMEVDKHFIKSEKQNQQKLLLFMNTPENRAKLAGTNFNIINANLLSKISGLQNNTTTNNNTINNNNTTDLNKANNMLNLKKCIKLSNVIKTEPQSPEYIRRNIIGLNTSSEQTLIRQNNCATINTTVKTTGINGILQTNVLQSLMKGDNNSHEVDSGYESPSSSSGSPCSPPTDLDRRDSYTEALQYIDIPPHERQPFYLSEEEKRTLIMEGLPVPTGLPLNKMEERALKKVRRKIKNKISAQESRRKKKEYMEALEKKVDCYASENNGLKKKISSLEVANRSLIMQVQKLQSMVSTKVTTKPVTTATNQTEEVTN